MGTVVFDFDSVLVPCESLEQVLSRADGVSPATMAEIARLTAAGMDGELPFEKSLRMRLELARPTLGDVMAVGLELAEASTRGAGELIATLQDAGHDVQIVSGGFRELLSVVGAALGVPRANIHGVRALWDEEGQFAGLEPGNGFRISKVEGMRRHALSFESPAVGVGDGATDLALREAGYVDSFVAYTEHARRPSVVAKADAEARSMMDLRAVLATLLA